MNQSKPTLTMAQRVAVIIMDVLLLVELAVCMYLSSRNPETMVPMFLKTYVPCALVTLVAARFTIKRLAPNRPEFPEIHEGV